MAVRRPWRALIWTLVGVLAVALAVGGMLDEAGRTQADRALTRALVTFAVARTLNGVISVAQGTEVALEPAGVGVNLTVGQALDPINDVVEQFSSVMLVAASSLGLQSVLLRISTWWGTTAVLLGAVVFAWVALWGGVPERFRAFALRGLIVGLLLRFGVPALVVCTNLFFETFLSTEHAEAAQMLELTRAEIQELNEEAETDVPAVSGDQSLLDRLGTMLDSTIEAMNVRDRLEALQQRVSDVIEQIVKLIVIFVLETIIVPLVFVWLFLTAAKSLGERVAKF